MVSTFLNDVGALIWIPSTVGRFVFILFGIVEYVDPPILGLVVPAALSRRSGALVLGDEQVQTTRPQVQALDGRLDGLHNLSLVVSGG